MYEETYSQPGIGVTVVSPGRPILVGRPLEVLFNLYPFFSLALSGAAALPVRHGQKNWKLFILIIQPNRRNAGFVFA